MIDATDLSAAIPPIAPANSVMSIHGCGECALTAVEKVVTEDGEYVVAETFAAVMFVNALENLSMGGVGS